MDEQAVAALRRLRAAFQAGRTLPLATRAAQLAALERLVTEEEARISGALARDLGKPAVEGLITDVLSVRREIVLQRRNLARWSRTRRVRLPVALRPGRAELRHEPLGVVLVVAPWNYPVNLVLVPLAAALAAGNTVVVKPSELAPATARLLAELIGRYLDPAIVAVVNGGPEVTEALIDGGVDHVLFTGSTAVGRKVMARAAATLTPVTLELGGKSPAYVDASADLGVAATRIAWGKFLNAGQTCIAPDHVLVHREVAGAFVERLVASVRALYGEEPRESPDYGRIVNDGHLARLEALLATSRATIACGGEVDHATRYLAPTVLVEPAADAPLQHEEIFGPLLPVIAVEDAAAAAARIAAAPVPLCAYVFTKERRVADRFIAATRSGSVCVNTTLEHFATGKLPFGGLGESGSGRYHGRYGFETFSHLRPVLRKANHPKVGLAYPPYRRRTVALLRRLL
ncbi:MAG TPA: aldehyde dehydrogenase family protein [Acidimicrobiales bacterium]|nr:aldehyde dehydrogenase family protein [Acidimicrobiales bacterium]